MHNPEQALKNIERMLVDDILETSDEDILKEFYEDEPEPEKEIARLKKLVEDVLNA